MLVIVIVCGASACPHTATRDGLEWLFWSHLSLSIVEETGVASKDWMCIFKVAVHRKSESKWLPVQLHEKSVAK